MQLLPFTAFSRPDDFKEEENPDFWEYLAEFEIEFKISISPLKTMRYPESPSVEKAWDNVGRHLYIALAKTVEKNSGEG